VHRERTAGGHGVSRVQREIHQHASDLALVGPHTPQTRTETNHNFDAVTHHPPEHPLEVRDGLVQVENFGLQKLAPAKGEQLVSERSRPLSSALNLLYVRPCLVARAQRISGETAIAEDYCEQVI
jgi:hypothetical protein